MLTDQINCVHDVARLLGETKTVPAVRSTSARRGAMSQLTQLISLSLIPLRLVAVVLRRLWSRPSGLLRGASLKDVSATGPSRIAPS